MARLIHGIHSKESLQATVAGDSYHHPVAKQNSYPDWRCEVLITTEDMLTGEHEPIYLEGKASDIRQVLATIIEMIDAEEKVKRQEWRKM